MPAKVVDASVLGAWCFREPRASEALGLLLGSDLYAPSLLAYELANIARKKAAAYPHDLHVFSQALATALALPIHWMEVDHVTVLRMALDMGLTTYDPSYLYVAQTMGAPLATFDQRLGRAARNAGG